MVKRKKKEEHKRKKTGKCQMLFVRVSTEMIEALDARAALATLCEGTGNYVPRKVTRSDVARWLIERSLEPK